MHSLASNLPPITKFISSASRLRTGVFRWLAFIREPLGTFSYWLVVLFAVAPHCGGYSFRLFVRFEHGADLLRRTAAVGIHVELAGARPGEGREK